MLARDKNAPELARHLDLRDDRYKRWLEFILTVFGRVAIMGTHAVG